MGFSRSSLSISENGAIVTLKDTLNNRQGSLLEYSFLLAIRLKGQIKTKYSLFLSCILGAMDNNFSPIRKDIDDGLIFMFLFSRGEGPASDCYFNTFTFCHSI